MEQRLIDANKLKQHYAWRGKTTERGKENKRLFDEIIDQQPTIGGCVSVKERLPEKRRMSCCYSRITWRLVFVYPLGGATIAATDIIRIVNSQATRTRAKSQLTGWNYPPFRRLHNV